MHGKQEKKICNQASSLLYLNKLKYIRIYKIKPPEDFPALDNNHFRKILK